jgi:serine/threonine protein kinase
MAGIQTSSQSALALCSNPRIVSFEPTPKSVFEGEFSPPHTALSSSTQDREEGLTLLQRHLCFLANLRCGFIAELLAATHFPLSLVMEGSQFGTLSTFITAIPGRNVGGSELFPWESRIQIAYDISRALEYLHDREIVHGLLSSATVLVSLADTPHLLLRGKLSGLGPKVCGTEPCAFWTGALHEQPSFAFDVWLFSVVLWHMFTLQDPHSSVLAAFRAPQLPDIEELVQFLRKALQAQLQVLAQRVPRQRASELGDLAWKGLRANPGERLLLQGFVRRLAELCCNRADPPPTAAPLDYSKAPKLDFDVVVTDPKRRFTCAAFPGSRCVWIGTNARVLSVCKPEAFAFDRELAMNKPWNEEVTAMTAPICVPVSLVTSTAAKELPTVAEDSRLVKFFKSRKSDAAVSSPPKGSGGGGTLTPPPPPSPRGPSPKVSASVVPELPKATFIDSEPPLELDSATLSESCISCILDIDGDTVWVSTDAGEIRMWHTDTGTILHTIQLMPPTRIHSLVATTNHDTGMTSVWCSMPCAN